VDSRGAEGCKRVVKVGREGGACGVLCRQVVGGFREAIVKFECGRAYIRAQYSPRFLCVGLRGVGKATEVGDRRLRRVRTFASRP
jgi:hypothetical protein